MHSNLDRRLTILEAKAAMTNQAQDYITLAEWKQCCAAGITPQYPDTPERRVWIEKMQPIWDAAAASLRELEDEPAIQNN